MDTAVEDEGPQGLDPPIYEGQHIQTQEVPREVPPA
eukprot:XP_001704477.1 Hypothetical protein GL50803_9655 [Giardia lamblia ATCC 50803]